MSVTGFPSIPANVDPAIRRALDSLFRAMSSGSSEWATATARSGAFIDKFEGGTIDVFDPPLAPFDLVVTGLYSMIMLEWDRTDQVGFAYVEIWRSESNDLGTAVLVGTTPAGMYIDTPPHQELSNTYYYWIRSVNQNSPPDYSAYNSATGTPGSTADDPGWLLDVLTAEITQGHLNQDLSDEIDRIDDIDTRLQALIDLQTSDQVYVQPTAPVPGVDGVPDPIVENSRWYDSDDDNHPYIYVDSAWVDLADPRIGQNENDITALDARITTNEGDITANADAFTVLDATVLTHDGEITSISSDVTDLKNTVNDPTTGVNANASAVSSLSSRVTTTENTSTANAADITSLETTVNDPTTGVSANATAVSTLDTRVTTNEGDISSQSASIVALQSDVGTNAANLTTEQSTRADADSAMASDISALEATVNDPDTGVNANAAAYTSVSARVTDTEYDIATNTSDIADNASGLSAEVHRVDLLSTDVSDNHSAILSEQTTRANADSAMATDISHLQTDSGQNSADILTEQTTRANADSALANDIHTLQVDVGGNTTSLQTKAEVSQGSSLCPALDDWVLNGQSIETVTDGVAGTTVLRLVDGSYPNAGMFIPIIEGRTYRVKFWARASSTCDGRLYFDLRQFIDVSTPGPTNNGRSPYKPSVLKSTHDANFGVDAWGEYTYDWGESDWQTGVKLFKPEFLDNYGTGASGYWEIQGLTIQDVSDSNAIYEVKADVNGRVTGFGLVADSTSTEFGVLADRFWIADPADPTNAQPLPFIVDNSSGVGTVYMNIAMIKDATITNALIQSVAADKITAGTITAALVTVGQLLRSSDSLVSIDMENKLLKMEDSSGDYVEMSPAALRYNHGGVYMFDVISGTVTIRNTAGDTVLSASGGVAEVSVDYADILGTKPPADADLTATSAFVATTYPADQAAIQTQLDGKIETWYTASDPSTLWSGANSTHEGDMWWNTSSHLLKRYSGTAWSGAIEDQLAINAYSNAATAQDTADGKRRVFVATPTVPYDIGDLWDRGTTGLWRCNTSSTSSYSISHWQIAADVTDSSTFVQTTYPADKTSIQSQLDGKIETWYTGTDPSSSWTGTEHEGDMWWNTSTNKLKRWDGSAWSADIEDQRAIDAYANAATAQDTADEKRRVFISTPAGPYDLGDLWDRGSTGGLWRCSNARVSGYAATDWYIISDITGNNTAANIVDQGDLATANDVDWDTQVTAKSGLAAILQINNTNIGTALALKAIGGAYIDDLAVDTLQIAGNAVTVPYDVTVASAKIAIPINTWYTVATTASLDFYGQDVIFFFGAEEATALCLCTGDYHVEVAVYTGSTQLLAFSKYGYRSAGGYTLTDISFRDVFTGPAGARQYVIKAKLSSSNGECSSVDDYITNSTIILLGCKR